MSPIILPESRVEVIHKDHDDDCVVQALRRVMTGERYLSPGAMNRPTEQASTDLDDYLQLYEALTDTEKELLHPLASGLTAAQSSR